VDTSFDFERLPSASVDTDWLALVREKVATLRYGAVLIIVHDGQVTQIERNEKTRLGEGQKGRPAE
jgi:hypothetical protein